MAGDKRPRVIGGVKMIYTQGGRRYQVTTSDAGGSTTITSAESAAVGERRGPKWIELNTTGGASPDMRVRVEVREGSPQVVELGWRARPGQREIRQKDLRDADVANLAIDLYASCIEQRQPFPKGPAGSFPSDDQLDEWSAHIRKSHQAARNFVDRQRRPREYRAINDELLRSVAEVYRASIDERAPTQAVAKHFGVGGRMASTYVQKARERGLLPPTVRGKKRA